jgi:hypothetical protein
MEKSHDPRKEGTYKEKMRDGRKYAVSRSIHRRNIAMHTRRGMNRLVTGTVDWRRMKRVCSAMGKANMMNDTLVNVPRTKSAPNQWTSSRSGFLFYRNK